MGAVTATRSDERGAGCLEVPDRYGSVGSCPGLWPLPNQRDRAALRARREGRWYGEEFSWMGRLEAGLREAHGSAVESHAEDRSDGVGRYFVGNRVRVYTHAGLDLPGRRDTVPVQIEFHENPTYATYGLAPQDYPRVFADPGALSKHRMPDDALCLYRPQDPPHQRWEAPDGLVELLSIITNHLYFEMRWRDGGADPNGGWLGPEAPHG